jgi:undecaprenyl pyrophosphate phosphatase UppP
MGMKDVVGSVAFFIALLGPLGIGLLVPARYLAGLLSAAWPVVIGVIMAISYGLPFESFGTWLINIAIVTASAAVYGIVVFSVKTKFKARRNKAI